MTMTRKVFFGTAGAALLPALVGADEGDGIEPLDDAGVLTIRDGDVLVIHLHHDVMVTAADVEDYRKTVQDVLGCEVIITTGVRHMEVARRADARGA